ncbi:MAG TPA: APC family permease [Actinomycetota bacterium]|nr:APC family permease [Actinomycetota bacterium]
MSDNDVLPPPGVDEAQHRRNSLRPEVPTRFRRLKAVVVGRPLSTERLVHERLGKPTALAVFASDNLSSSAYATEEILNVLVKAAAVGIFAMVVPITLALLGVLGILLFSYRQTIKAYPGGGGAYLVTRDNFGLLPAQVAGVALMTDYVLTVSVSVAAGTAALTSAFGALFPYRVIISLFFILILTMGNLRGLKEAGRMFALPTYFFITMMGVMFAVGGYRWAAGALHPVPTFPHSEIAAVGFFVVLHAFSSGGAAVTGVEAISNGVPAFKPPEWRNARTTLMWMGSLLGAMFLGLSILDAKLKVIPDPTGAKTVLAQVGQGVFGHSGFGTVAYYGLQAATMLILVLAANTSYADFPRLASFIAIDRYLPRQLARYGDRLVFSNGIVVLAALASSLVIIFKASVTGLIPLYAIGVFTSFTFSQSGMARHHRREREPGWKRGLLINGFGAVVSGLMTVIIAATKFTQGAWVILVIVPVAVAGLVTIHRHYQEAAVLLRRPDRTVPKDFPRQRVIIPDIGDAQSLRATLAYAQRVWPTEIRVVRLARPGEDTTEFLRARPLAGEVREAALIRDGSKAAALRGYLRSVRREVGPGEVLNVIIPETVEGMGLRYILRQRRIQRLKSTLLAEPDVVLTNLPTRQGYEHLEPGERAARGQHATQPWRHVAVVLVAGVHNASLSGLRYARSLGADELHCLHVETTAKETEAVLAEWHAMVGSPSLEVLPSPYREIVRPIHERVRRMLDADPHTYVTIVIPEFVVRKTWHNALHNHTALLLKRAFLFEPSVVVSAVPYRLDKIEEAPASAGATSAH